MEKLIPLLDSATKLLQYDEDNSMMLTMMIHQTQTDLEYPFPVIQALLKEVENYPELKMFDDMMQVFGNSATRVQYASLIHWLIMRSVSVGSERTIFDLKRYISSSEIPFLEVIAIAGLEIKSSCDVGKGITLIPWGDFPSGYENDFMYGRSHIQYIHSPTSALIRETMIKVAHVPDDQTKEYMNKKYFEDMLDALLCIGLIGPVSPYAISNWIQPPEWAVVTNYPALSFSVIDGIPSHSKLPDNEYNEIKTLFESFLRLNEDAKSALRIPISRLNSAMRKPTPVDSAIDLGIALEAIFLNDLNDDRGELVYRLKIRASRYLGNTLEERKNLFRIFGDLYKARSKAVHTGELDDIIRKINVNVLLDSGFNYAATALRKIILKGKPVWNDIELAE